MPIEFVYEDVKALKAEINKMEIDHNNFDLSVRHQINARKSHLQQLLSYCNHPSSQRYTPREYGACNGRRLIVCALCQERWQE
jgi:hypothetical protein